MPDSLGAFCPYTARHAGVTAMLHAERREGGTYSEREVARQFGHTVQTLDRVYADIPDDFHGIAGMSMDEIIRSARREVWGPMPADRDYRTIEYDLREAADITGIGVRDLPDGSSAARSPGSSGMAGGTSAASISSGTACSTLAAAFDRAGSTGGLNSG